MPSNLFTQMGIQFSQMTHRVVPRPDVDRLEACKWCEDRMGYPAFDLRWKIHTLPLLWYEKGQWTFGDNWSAPVFLFKNTMIATEFKLLFG